MPLDSKFYIERQVDQDFQTAIQRRDSIVLLKGPRQVAHFQKKGHQDRSILKARFSFLLFCGLFFVPNLFCFGLIKIDNDFF
ncbi:MAG: hypothetical protein VSS75_032165 [Candidatus Parabeggiatoa sp.]|nr:hypothetical protein [Candidatus Parabeggiatoa sp.]